MPIDREYLKATIKISKRALETSVGTKEQNDAHADYIRRLEEELADSNLEIGTKEHPIFLHPYDLHLLLNEQSLLLFNPPEGVSTEEHELIPLNGQWYRVSTSAQVSEKARELFSEDWKQSDIYRQRVLDLARQ